VPFAKAIELSKLEGLDLALVAENADPPVCKIMNFGKYIYEQKKKEKEQKKHHHAQKVKELKFTASIDPHDYQTKLRHAIEFLKDGSKLRATMMFRGREMAHQELGMNIIKKLIKDLEEFAESESEPKLFGRNLIVNFNPKNSK